MRFLLIAIGLAAAGCSDDPVSRLPDAPPAPDAAPENCLVDPSYTLGAIGGIADVVNGANTATFTIDPDPPRDSFFFKLTGITPGTYTIDGANADFNACTLCVNIIADIVAMQGPTKFYQAQSGSVTLTAVGPVISGSVANLVFREVSLATGAIVGTCTTTVASADFMAD